MTVHIERIGTLVVDARHDGGDVRGGRRILDQDPESGTVESRDHRILTSHHGFQPLREIGQQPLARTTAEAVANHVERVEFQVEQGDAAHRIHAQQHGFGMRAEELPVGQAGEDVVQGLAAQLALQQHQLGTVLGDDDELRGLIVGASQQRRRQRDARDVAVGAPQPLSLLDPLLTAVEQRTQRFGKDFGRVRMHQVRQPRADQLGG